MKMSFKKHSSIERHYRDYRCFGRSKFKNNLNEKLSEGISNWFIWNYFHWIAEQTCSIKKETSKSESCSIHYKNLAESDYA